MVVLCQILSASNNLPKGSLVLLCFLWLVPCYIFRTTILTHLLYLIYRSARVKQTYTGLDSLPLSGKKILWPTHNNFVAIQHICHTLFPSPFFSSCIFSISYCPLCSSWLNRLSNVASHLQLSFRSFLYSPSPAFTSPDLLFPILPSTSLPSRSFPPSFPRGLCVSHPPTL